MLWLLNQYLLSGALPTQQPLKEERSRGSSGGMDATIAVNYGVHALLSSGNGIGSNENLRCRRDIAALDTMNG